MTQPLRIGILGAGRIARNAVAPALHATPETVLAGVASRDPERAAALQPERVYADYATLLADPTIEAVYIGTHNGLHCELACAAFEHGKHVLCDKPLACNAAEVAQMQAAAQRTQRVLLEGFMYRHRARTKACAAWVQSGAVGAVNSIVTQFSFAIPDRGDVRMHRAWGGGGALDVGCYCVSLCRLLYGAEPHTVQARAAFDPECDVDMALHGVLDFGDGRFAVVSCGFDGGFRQHALISGTEGALTVEFPFGPPPDHDGAIVCRRGTDVERRTFAAENPFELQAAHFARVVRGEEPPLITAADSLGNARVLDALLASARRAGAAVTVAS